MSAALDELASWQKSAGIVLNSVLTKGKTFLSRKGKKRHDIASEALACKDRRKVSTDKILRSLEDDIARRQGNGSKQP
jgi:hypothetical protein